MKKVYFYLTVLALFAVNMTTKAQYEVYLTQEPTSDYSYVTATLDLTKLASSVDLTSEDLRNKLANDGAVEIMQANGLYKSGATTSEPNGYWMTEGGYPTTWGNNSAWYVFVTTDGNDLKIHAGQYENRYINLQENLALSTTLSICNQGKRATIDVYFTIKVEQQVHATFENAAPTGNASWDGSTNTLSWSATSWNQLRNIGLPSGNLLKYKKLVVDCKINQGDQFRILFYQGDVNKTLYVKDGVNEFILIDALKEVAPDDWEYFLTDCSEICLSGDNVTASGSVTINDIYLEKLTTAIQGLDSLVIEMTQAGELGNLVLDSVENFSDVKKLKVIGPINSTDMERIAAMTSATEIDLGEASGLTTLSSNIFQNNRTLERIILPNSLTKMSSYAFENCSALRYVYIPGSLVDQTGYEAFGYCYQLETVELGEGITTIRENMFSNCYRLKTVQFPSTLKIIESSAFYNCYSLTNFTLPYGLTTIGYRAFYRSSIDASISVDYYYDDENEDYQDVYVDNVSPTTLIFPWSLISIGDQAFVNWRDLTSVQFNEGLISIESNAFAGNNVTTITLPSTLTQIGSNIFTNKNITVTSNALIPPTETQSNSSTVSYPGTLYVPNIAVKAYKQAKGWTSFNIVGFDYVPNDIVVAGELTLEVKNGAFAAAKPNVWLNSNPQNTSYSNAKYGALSVKGDETLSMGTFHLLSDPNSYERTYYSDYRDYRCYATLINNASMRADNVNTRLYISSDQWFFFSFPYDVKVSDIIDAVGNAQWVIRKYDGEKRAAAATDETWVNVGADDILNAYQGYIWRMGQRGTEYWGAFDIPAINNINKNNIFANTDVEITLAEYQSEFAHNRSWNLIGNPYPCYYDTRAMEFTAPITVWNRYRGNYEAYSPVDDSYILAPNEAFFVQRPIDQENIVFKKEGRQHGQAVNADASYEAKMRGVAARSVRNVFNLTLSDGENEDRTRVVFNEEAKKEYELDKDASKFMAYADIPQLFSLNKDVRYAINERPFDKGLVCLGYKVAANGTYTIAVNTKAKGTVMLEDTETGEVMNLSESAYSFSATAGTNESRFILHFNGEDATSIQGIDIVEKANISELYTLDGRRLNGTVTTGVYLMKKGQTFQKVFVK